MILVILIVEVEGLLNIRLGLAAKAAKQSLLSQLMLNLTLLKLVVLS